MNKNECGDHFYEKIDFIGARNLVYVLKDLEDNISVCSK